MECASAQSLIDGYLDRELDPAQSLAMEAHLRACPACSQSYQGREALRDALKSDDLYFKAPDELERRIQRAIHQVGIVGTAGRWRAWSWPRVIAPLAAAALVLVTLLPYFSGSTREELLTEAVISGHIRSLMADHLADVASSDRHTVRPWFNGKLDFSPPVEDLAAAGFPLTGGRLDYLSDRAVAALIYRRDSHIINVFVWPSSDSKSTAVKATQRQGYKILYWTNSGLNFWVVSDLEHAQLERFAELLKGPSS